MTDQSFKGKGKVTDWDDNQSISLSEYHYSPVPRSTPLETSGDLTQASYYFNNNNYSFETNGSEQACYADTLSRSPGTTTENTYGGDSTYHMNPTDLAHDDVNWDAMSLVSVFTDVTAQMSVFSSSSRSSSRASAAPSRISNVDTHINRQGPTRQRYQLPCELRRLGCNQVFNGDEEMEWMDHTETHLEGSFPSKLKCWFCDDLGLFDAKARGWDNRYNFGIRMQHIRGHIIEGERLQDIRPDGLFINFMKKKRLIDEQQYQTLLRSDSGRPPPAAAPAGSHQHQHRRSHRHLEAVVEEAGPSSSAASKERRRRSDKKSEHTRDRKK